MDPISTSADSRAVALARRVLRIEAAAVAALADPIRRAALGEAGWRAARGPYAWEGEAERLVALYRDLGAGPGGAVGL